MKFLDAAGVQQFKNYNDTVYVKTEDVLTVDPLSRDTYTKDEIDDMLEDFIETESDPVFSASAAAGIQASDITNWNSKTSNTGTITGITMNGASKGTSGVVNLGTVLTEHQDISGKADKSAAIGSLSLSLDSTNYKITLSGTKVDGTSFTVSNVIDLPLESVVVNGSYNNTTKKVVLTLQNGNTVDFSVADLVSGLQSEITSTNKLSADLISDGTTNKTVTATEKSTWNGKQDALVSGTNIKTINNNSLLGDGNITIVEGTGGNAKIFYGTCSTAAATAAKEVVCSSFTSSELVNGALIYVTFTNTNSAAVADLTLNINSTGAKKLQKQANAGTTNLASAGELRASSTYLFQYNSTLNSSAGAWVCMTLDYNTTYSALTSADMQAGTATTGRTITAARVKEAVQYWDAITEVQVNGTALTPDSNKAVNITVPSEVTESTVSGWGFTKNTGTYSKPSGGIPASDLTSAVQTSLGKADTALQSYIETDPVYSASAAAGITSSDISNWNSKTSNVGTITGITMNGSSKGTSGVVNLGTVVTSETDPVFLASAAAEISLSDIINWDNKTSNVGTITSVKMNGSTVSSSGEADLGTVITSHATHKLTATNGTATSASGTITYVESLTGTNTATSGDLTVTATRKTVTIPTVNNSTISIQKGGTAVDSFTTNASSAKTINIPNELPSYSSSDSGKVLSVNSSGSLVWVTPAQIYSGSSAPNNSNGNNGDLYVQTL